jgi:pyridoxamine 5'-phosphate oxidase
MSIPWLEWFRGAVAQAGLQPLVLALATVDEMGRPQVRSVVCRRIEKDGSLWMTSDSRSGKNTQIRRNAQAAAVCWLAVTREQFRFSGVVDILDTRSSSPDRIEMWQSLSPATRATFFWPAPGQARTLIDANFPAASDASAPPDSFEVLILRPGEVEHLRVGVHPHQRVRWVAERDWGREELNP